MQVLAYHHTSARPSPGPMLTSCLLALRNTYRWNLNPNTCTTFQENVFENVFWRMVAIFPVPICHNTMLVHVPGLILSVFMKIIRHFWWLGPNVWWEISQIWIEYMKFIGRMSDEPWKFFGYTVSLTTWINFNSSMDITSCCGPLLHCACVYSQPQT